MPRECCRGQFAARFLRDFLGRDYTDLAAHVEQHLEPRNPEAGSFELGFDLILDGLERLGGT